MVTKQDLLDYLLIEADDMAEDAMTARRIDRCIKAAEVWLKEASTENADLADPIAEELVLKAAGDLYENRAFAERGQSGKVSAAMNRMAADFLMQLRLKYGGGHDD